MRQIKAVATLLAITLILLILPGCTSHLNPGTSAAPTATPTVSSRVFAANAAVDGLDGYWSQHIDDAYEYPFTAETHPDEWKKADSLYRREAQNLPQDVLRTISTLGLVETCFNNSFFIDFLMGANVYAGSIQSFESFNSGRELLSRPDAATALIDYYKSINVEMLYDTTPGALRLRYIEYVISDDRLIAAMSTEQRVALLHAVMASVQNRDRMTTLELNFMSSALLVGKLLLVDSDAFRADFAGEEQIAAYLASGEMLPEPMDYPYRELLNRFVAYIPV